MSKDWNELEEYLKENLEFDNPKRTPLSGGTKHEEDVVGFNLLAQCKFTTNKNVSILAKDLNRLIFSANLLKKFPLFLTESKLGKVISFPITDSTKEMVMLSIKLDCVVYGFDNLLALSNTCTDLKQLEAIEREYNRINKIYINIKNTVDQIANEIKRLTKIKQNSLTMFDLFDQGETNGAQ